MKGISSSSLFQLPRVCDGGRNSGGDARLNGCRGGSINSSSKIVAKKSKDKRPPPSKDSKPPPPRITSNLKQSLQILRYWKEDQKRNSTTPKPATRYRRKKVEKEDLPEEKELSHDPTFDGKYEDIEGADSVLLVDGYNLCGYWPKLKKDFMSGRLNIARQNLLEELVTYSRMREMKVVVVFDAMRSGRRTHREKFHGIDVVYSAQACADDWIEKEVVLLREDGCPWVRVATSDRYEQEAAIVAGAWVWSCQTLISDIDAWIKYYSKIPRRPNPFQNIRLVRIFLQFNKNVALIEDSQKELERIEKYRPTSMDGRLLKYNLNPKVVAALKDLRDKLAEKERRR